MYAKNQNDPTSDSRDTVDHRTLQSNWLTAMSDQAHLRKQFQFLSFEGVYVYVKLSKLSIFQFITSNNQIIFQLVWLRVFWVKEHKNKNFVT